MTIGQSAFEKSGGQLSIPAHFVYNTCNCFNLLTNSMSQHRSLKGTGTIAARRNVLKRFERVELLKKRGQWKDGQKVIGLPKTKPDV